MYPEGTRSINDIAPDSVGQLLTWYLQDPPDANEIERNGRIESVQGNRNPYVDRPVLVCRAMSWLVADRERRLTELDERSRCPRGTNESRPPAGSS